MLTNKEELANLAVNLRLWLEEKGKTQTDLAAASGVPQPTISNLLREKYDPSVCAVSRLAKALKKPIDDLLSPPPRRKLQKSA